MASEELKIELLKKDLVYNTKATESVERKLDKLADDMKVGFEKLEGKYTTIEQHTTLTLRVDKHDKIINGIAVFIGLAVLSAILRLVIIS